MSQITIEQASNQIFEKLSDNECLILYQILSNKHHNYFLKILCDYIEHNHENLASQLFTRFEEVEIIKEENNE